jgi:hypothetical protein
VTVDTGSVALTVGNNYVVLLADTGNDQGFADLGLDGYFSHPGVAGDGGFNFYNNDHSLSSIGANAWDDPQDYGSLAWDAQFAVPVTEPASVLLLGVGVTGLGVFHRRRRRRA